MRQAQAVGEGNVMAFRQVSDVLSPDRKRWERATDWHTDKETPR